MKFYKLPKTFPQDVLEEAKHVVDKLKDPGRRLDLRKKFIFTCDPATAKDFDDALSLETDRKGNRVLGVHIADVSHFVRPGSALDREAYKRSTSVYFADRVVPMLPEELSNGVCSLVPGEERLLLGQMLPAVGHRVQVRHRAHRGVAAPRRGPGAGEDRLFIRKTRLTKMHMHIAKAGKDRVFGRGKTGKSGVAALEKESGCRGLIVAVCRVEPGHTGYLRT